MDFIERHSYALLFAWVLAEQGAVPLPSVPLLLATGALARLGRLQILPAAACCVAAALLADTTWFLLGRRRGKRILHWICRISLEPDSCVRRTQDTFVRYGLRSLLVSKFVPGLNAVAAPLAGSSGFTFWRFLVFDVAGSVIWTAAYLGLGYSVAGELEHTMVLASRLGSHLFFLLAGSLVLWIVWKLFERQRFLRGLGLARITPAELRRRLEVGEEMLVVDLRSGLEDRPSLIPGAIRVSTDDLSAALREVPRDREIILFCS